MKRYVRSSNTQNKYTIQSSAVNPYTDRYNINVDGQKFTVYTAYGDDPENIQFQISEVHPYDDAKYAWAKKDRPVGATVYKDGKRYGFIELRDVEEYFESEPNPSPEEYIKEIIEYTCKELRNINRNVKPVMVHW